MHLLVRVPGAVLRAVVDSARKRSVTVPGARLKYHPFSDIPMREYIPVLVAASCGIYPTLPVREALRKLGRGSRAAFQQSLIGRIVLANFTDLRQNLAVFGKALSIATPSARVVVQDVGEGRAVVRLSNIYTFIDSHCIGILEKVAGASKLHVESRVHLTSPYDGEIELTWLA